MNQSPTSTKKEIKPFQLMTFGEALEQVLKGRSVKRKAWTEDAFVFLKEDFLYIRRNGEDHSLLVHKEDIVNADWYFAI
jgi:hypothetical protein